MLDFKTDYGMPTSKSLPCQTSASEPGPIRQLMITKRSNCTTCNRDHKVDPVSGEC